MLRTKRARTSPSRTAPSVAQHQVRCCEASDLPNTIAPAVAPLLVSVTAFTVVQTDSGRNYARLFLGSAVTSAATLLKVKAVR